MTFELYRCSTSTYGGKIILGCIAPTEAAFFDGGCTGIYAANGYTDCSVCSTDLCKATDAPPTEPAEEKPAEPEEFSSSLKLRLFLNMSSMLMRTVMYTMTKATSHVVVKNLEEDMAAGPTEHVGFHQQDAAALEEESEEVQEHLREGGPSANEERQFLQLPSTTVDLACQGSAMDAEDESGE